MSSDDLPFYDRVAEELKSGQIDQGLWLKVKAEMPEAPPESQQGEYVKRRVIVLEEINREYRRLQKLTQKSEEERNRDAYQSECVGICPVCEVGFSRKRINDHKNLYRGCGIFSLIIGGPLFITGLSSNLYLLITAVLIIFIGIFVFFIERIIRCPECKSWREPLMINGHKDD